ncbi:Murein DD-endopeptidase MepM and murein hydrolase activator NlpD, contain LysM domain [Catalinimonas alkaloidigena]|uniref:Murein DD-endopeptidase MepM and murein hydrolase activator NlpD, contain LysM domain n=1 Tax=Catalinimonas alkaloidigena TaxID=1075417 RepID=A0A1G9DM30_9BACT|nr:peptidoglycan DD-metalloendopeptidase family protein [Catalinimonas alkaloidigena]SDK64914.1 Murein DD-endopeptidase MepM and murein hydrolase activator NlpD, contain LysM domain [Catalinimonas alkaloidigena]
MVFFCFLTLWLAGCGGAPLRRVLQPATPYEKYARALQQVQLDETALGQAWLAAGERALRDSLEIDLPYRESGYFPANEAVALSYRVALPEGQKLRVKVETEANQPLDVFVDLFRQEDQKAKPLVSADSSLTFEYEVDETGAYLIRVQPELLRSGRYDIYITQQPVLSFPVEGGSNRSVQSFWGAARDGGGRRHEGIDIFAKRGTPALAAVNGRVSRVGTTRLGGKVVWITDLERGQSLYYAHLDSQLVQIGQRVTPGDTVGLVGNTGNARTTPPHLHFGIYRFGQGAIDPYAFVQQFPQETIAPATTPTVPLAWQRTGRQSVNLRTGPGTDHTVIRTCTPHTPLQVLAATGDWERIRLPDGTEGYLFHTLVEPLTRPIRQWVTSDASRPLLDTPRPDAPLIQYLPTETSVAILAEFNDFALADVAGQWGWVQQPKS